MGLSPAGCPMRLLVVAAALAFPSCARGSGDAAPAAAAAATPAATAQAVGAEAQAVPQPPPPAEPAFGPVVAGMFYPAGARELETMIDGFLAAAKDQPLPEPLLGMMVPHAGYRYSGLAAAHGYRLLRDRPITQVVILAPSHQMPAPYAAVLDRRAYATPLGEVPIARDLVQQLLSSTTVVRADARLFAREHSLEVQLPFLQRVLPGVAVLPLVLGSRDPGLATELARALYTVLGERRDVLVLASSDMSHYLPYEEGNRIDEASTQIVLALDPAALHQALATDRAQLCGGAAVVTLIELLRLRGGHEAKLLFHNNSGDVSGDRSRVVGYGVVAFGGAAPTAVARATVPEVTPVAASTAGEALSSAAGAGPAEPGYQLTQADKDELLRLARSTVESWVTRGEVPPYTPRPGRLSEPGAAFVTLKKHGELRGCIGHTEARMPLYRCIQSVAVAAASEDPRFSPVRPDELPLLSYEVSVLTPLTPLPDPLQVRVGIDGLLVSWQGRRGLLLPQVPGEHGWDKEQFLAHTCNKAGLPPDCWRQGARFQKFQAIVFP